MKTISRKKNVAQNSCFAILSGAMALLFVGQGASALPAFARKENVSCIMCHADGAAPHLNKLGYLYRRMAFHLPGKLGDEKSDDGGMKVTNHLAVGANVGYEYTTNTASNGKKSTSANGITVPEAELWPLVGGFSGNFGAWSEIDLTPQTNTDGGVKLGMADLRYATGTTDFFYNFRAGLISPEGFGASDQWFDDGNVPLMDQMTPNKVQDSMVVPFGAMEMPQLGAEAGINYHDTHVTLGMYNGFTDVDSISNGTASQSSSLMPASTKPKDQGMRDYRLVLDQFVGDLGAITLGYYHGSVPLILPSDSTKAWLDHFDQARAYITAFAIPGVLDVLGGAGWMRNEYVSATNSTGTPDGKYSGKAGFIGANYYASPHLVVSGRLDRFDFNSDQSSTGYSLQLSMPYNNHVVIFHYNHTASAFASGPVDSPDFTNDFGLVVRFLL